MEVAESHLIKIYKSTIYIVSITFCTFLNLANPYFQLKMVTMAIINSIIGNQYAKLEDITMKTKEATSIS